MIHHIVLCSLLLSVYDLRFTIYESPAVCCLLFTSIHDLNGFVNIRPVFFRNDPKRDSFFVPALVFTTTTFLVAVTDWLRSDSLGIGFSVGNGFKRGNGFNPGKAGNPVSSFEFPVSSLLAAGDASGFISFVYGFSEIAAAPETVGNGWRVSCFGC